MSPHSVPLGAAPPAIGSPDAVISWRITWTRDFALVDAATAQACADAVDAAEATHVNAWYAFTDLMGTKYKVRTNAVVSICTDQG